MTTHSYAQTSPFSVDNFHFQKAPLPSSFTRFAHKNFFSTEFIHIHVDFCFLDIIFRMNANITVKFKTPRMASLKRSYTECSRFLNFFGLFG